MIVALKHSIPYVTQALPEFPTNKQWFANKKEDNIKQLADTNFTNRGIVTDNHSTNAKSFSNNLNKAIFP